MFRKIVSSLSFSPALIGQLGFYAKRLRKEEATRRLGLIFLVLALIVQSLVVFQPSESANAANQNDFVAGGLGLGSHRSLNNFLSPYDANVDHLKDIMNYMGISRQEIASATFTSWTAGNKYSWGFNPRFSYAQGERQVTITDPNGAALTSIYARPNKLFGGANAQIWGWVGHSDKVGWFAIMQACGNLVTDIIPPPPPPPMCIVNTQILASNKDCRPCPGNTSLWINDKSCIPNIVKTKTGINISQGSVDTASVIAQASDQIRYTLTIENTGLNTTTAKLEDHLADVLEYATLVDNGGGTFDNTTKVLSWPDVQLAPHEKQVRTFLIRVVDVIPATAQGASDPTSYDCIMTNVFGNEVETRVNCPSPKVIEKVVTQLPTTGPTENMIFAGVALAIVTYFYARTRQVKKEVRLIRRSVNTGTI